MNYVTPYPGPNTLSHETRAEVAAALEAGSPVRLGRWRILPAGEHGQYVIDYIEADGEGARTQGLGEWVHAWTSRNLKVAVHNFWESWLNDW